MEVRAAYRRLFRYGLRAVQYRVPQKFVVRDVLRRRFASSGLVVTPSQLENTVQFVKNASEHGGMELQILRNMVHVEYSRFSQRRLLIARDQATTKAYDHYYATVDALNKTMDLAL